MSEDVRFRITPAEDAKGHQQGHRGIAINRWNKT